MVKIVSARHLSHEYEELALPQALGEDGKGRILIVDGGGSKRCALLGDNIAEMGYKNGWSVSQHSCSDPSTYKLHSSRSGCRILILKSLP